MTFSRRGFAATVLAPFAAAQEKALRITPDRLQKVELFLAQEMTRQTLPGLSIALAEDGQLRYAKALGLADLENNIPMSTQSRVRLASVAKPMTAVAILQLVEQGKVNLDAEIQTWLPNFPRKQWPVTPRLLLGHLAGIRSYRGKELDSTIYYSNRLEPLKLFADDPLVAEPGTRYVYSSYGYNILGAIVETVAAQPFMTYLQEKVLRPAAASSIVADDTFAIIPNRVRGYQLAEGKLENCGLTDTSNKIPGGGLLGTAQDIVRFALALSRGRLLKAESLDAMYQPMKLKDGKQQGYGMGWTLGKLEGKTWRYHTGGQQGTSSFIGQFPEEDLQIAVLTNRTGAAVDQLAQGVVRVLLDKEPLPKEKV
jgi:serine beta-lactamase-like protein LACTB, mitochondrial